MAPNDLLVQVMANETDLWQIVVGGLVMNSGSGTGGVPRSSPYVVIPALSLRGVATGQSSRPRVAHNITCHDTGENAAIGRFGRFERKGIAMSISLIFYIVQSESLLQQLSEELEKGILCYLCYDSTMAPTLYRVLSQLARMIDHCQRDLGDWL